MADAIVVRMTGWDPVIKRMLALPEKARSKPGRRALGRAAAVVKAQAKRNALLVDDPDTGRRIADNIGQRLRSGFQRRTGDLMVSVGVLSEHGRIPRGNPDTGPRGNTPHWHLVELGTATAAAQPFLRNALAESVDRAINAFQVAFSKELDKAGV